ncbi:MAG: MaoC family dehydratase [Clostridiales Family XIII bacterium]|nr:MaoC family dehydratase [Clostridiales Family XIII bacterium]
MIGYTIDEMHVGQTASYAKTITESDVYLFAGVTGDANPMHINEEYAKATRFGGRIAHGILSAGLISAVMGMYLPGWGGIYLGQELKFLAPVRIGDTITATAEVLELDKEKNRAVIRTYCTNQHGTVVTDGKAMVMPARA